MTTFAETVRSCFPAAQGDSDGSILPSHNTRSRSQKLKEKLTPSAVVRSYAWDWALVVIFWVILGVLNQMGGHKREFSLNDISIQHSFAEIERVDERMLVFISLGIPLLGLVPIGAFVYKSGWDVHNSILGLLMSYTFTGFVTQLIKMNVGRPRPDLIARCQPIPGSVDHPVYGLSNHKICTSTNAFILNDGFKSFPSGHSSLSFAGLGFLTLYLCGKLHLYDRRGHRTRAWLALAPCLGATMVAVTRTMDNRHHWQDVLVGSTLGLAIAYVAYRAYFPALSHKYAHLPLAPRPPSALSSDGDSESDAEPESRSAQRDQRIRLMSTDEVVPRNSEEEQAWGA